MELAEQDEGTKLATIENEIKRIFDRVNEALKNEPVLKSNDTNNDFRGNDENGTSTGKSNLGSTSNNQHTPQNQPHSHGVGQK